MGTAWLPASTLIVAEPFHSRQSRSASCSEKPNASMNSASAGRLSSRPVLGQHLGDGELVDRVVPRADDVLLPGPPVVAWLQQ
jgi:hypothetical protein